MDTGRFVVEYHPDFLSVCTESDIQRKIDDLNQASVIWYPRVWRALQMRRMKMSCGTGKGAETNSMKPRASLDPALPDAGANQVQAGGMTRRSRTAQRVASLYTSITSADGWVLMKHKQGAALQKETLCQDVRSARACFDFSYFSLLIVCRI